MTALYHVGSLKCLKEVTTEISKLGISHLVCGPRNYDPPRKKSLPLLWVSCSHSRNSESHKIQVWELGIATPERNPNSTTDFNPELRLRHPCFGLISTLEVADSMTKETHFSSVDWSLSTSHDHICHQWIHSLLWTLHQPQSRLLLEHPSKKLHFSLLQEK